MIRHTHSYLTNQTIRNALAAQLAELRRKNQSIRRRNPQGYNGVTEAMERIASSNMAFRIQGAMRKQA